MKMRKMVINENQIVRLVTEELKKSDVIDLIKRDKDFERKVKEIIADTLTEFFRVLYQHSGVFKSMVR